jgi:hypothetical protein
MKDFEALKDIWHSQLATPKVSYDDVIKGIKKSKSSFANKLLFEIIGMLVMMMLFILIWLKTYSTMWTTHLSFLIILGCCLYYLYAQIRDYISISDSGHLLKEPKEYVLYLKKYSRKRYVLNTTKYRMYSIFTALAFSLYFVEIYYSSPLWQTLVGLSAIVLWFIFCWYLMRIYKRKEQEKLNSMITNLEALEDQLTR